MSREYQITVRDPLTVEGEETLRLSDIEGVLSELGLEAVSVREIL